MKIISIIGSSAQKVLLPLLQYPERFDSAVFIVQKSKQEAYSYIKSFLDEKRDRTGREFRYREVPEINSPDYDSFYDTVAGLLWESFAGNEKAVLNISGGTSYMILAGVQAAKAMNVPVMYVDSNKLIVQTVKWDMETGRSEISSEHIDTSGLEVKDLLALCNFYPSYLIPDDTLPGIQYERWVYEEFRNVKESGFFDSIDRNIILSWDSRLHARNEIDIIYLRRNILGFVSVKSGTGVQFPPVMKKTSRELKSIYPKWLLKAPCMRVLISRYALDDSARNSLVNEGVLVLDGIFCCRDLQKAVNRIVEETDRLADADPVPDHGLIETFTEKFYDGNDEA